MGLERMESRESGRARRQAAGRGARGNPRRDQEASGFVAGTPAMGVFGWKRGMKAAR